MSMGFVEMLSYLCGICFFLCGFLSLLLQLLFSTGSKTLRVRGWSHLVVLWETWGRRGSFWPTGWDLRYIHLSNANKRRCGIFIVLFAAMPCVYRQRSSLIACNVKTCHIGGVNHPYRVTEMETVNKNLFPAVQDSTIFITYTYA